MNEGKGVVVFSLRPPYSPTQHSEVDLEVYTTPTRIKQWAPNQCKGL